jgi:hypothetical protein
MMKILVYIFGVLYITLYSDLWDVISALCELYSALLNNLLNVTQNLLCVTCFVQAMR